MSKLIESAKTNRKKNSQKRYRKELYTPKRSSSKNRASDGTRIHRITFSEVINDWYNANRLKYKGATEAKYNYLITRHILPELGSLLTNDINSNTLNDFVYKKSVSGRLDGNGGLSPSYVRTIFVIVKAAIDHAVANGVMTPLKINIIKPPMDNHELRVLDHKEQSMLEDYLLRNMDNTALGIYLTLNTGLRIGEICALSWDDIDLNERVIHIRGTVSRVKAPKDSSLSSMLIIDKPKTKSSYRIIPISSKLMPVLCEMKNSSSSKYVISLTNDFISPRTYESRYHKIMKNTDLPSVNYHALRHTFATRCIEAGVDMKTLSEILGHSNISTTMNTYVHSSMELKRLQLEKIGMF